mmetsp:Transcript_3532/g.10856  ORF Transcript_3532/g.10856 Transcript_3532/m.10856 type:complete len:460 (-) Transcript_3532:158-1537(-)
MRVVEASLCCCVAVTALSPALVTLPQHSGRRVSLEAKAPQKTERSSVIPQSMPVDRLEDYDAEEERSSLVAEHWPRLAILGCACVYGSNFAVVKTLDAAMIPSLSASFRFGLACVACAPIAARFGKEARETSFWLGAAEAGVANALGYVAQAVGLETVDASVSAFVCSLAVVVVPALDSFILRKPTSRATWVGAAVASLGVACLSLDCASGTVSGARPTCLGVLATACQPLCFGYGFWRTEQLFQASCAEESDAATTTPVRAAAAAAAEECLLETKEEEMPLVSSCESSQCLVAASLCCAATQLAAVKGTADVWLLTDVARGHLGSTARDVLRTFESAGHFDVLSALVWTGLVTTALTVVFETLALSKISARESSLIFTTEPLFGAAWASLLLHEHFGARALLGGALVIAACLSTALASGGAAAAGDAADSSFLVAAERERRLPLLRPAQHDDDADSLR